MKNTSCYRVLMIGGGIGGLTAAIAMQRAGHEVEVYDQASQFLPSGTGLGIINNGLQALRRLDIAMDVSARGVRLARFSIQSWDGRVLWECPIDEYERVTGGPAIGIHRADLHEILLAHCGDIPVHTDHRLVSYSQDTQGVWARFANGHEVRGDVLIGSDGLRSAVRTQLLGPRPPRAVGATFWNGLVDEGDVAEKGCMVMRMGKGSMFLTLPIGRGLRVWGLSLDTHATGRDIDRAVLGKIYSDDTVNMAKLKARFRDWAQPLGDLIERTPDDQLMRWDVFDRPPIRRWSQGRVTLLGDAAHPMAPTAGQGANQAIEDALAVVDCLSAHRDPVAGLQAYERLRIPRTTRIAREAHAICRATMLHQPLACWLRDSMIKATPWFVDRVFRTHIRNPGYIAEGQAD